MGVISPERVRRRPPAEPPPQRTPPPEPPERRDVPWGLIALCVVIIAVFGSVNWVRGLLPDFDNPFASETIDRSGPAVLQSIQDLRAYHAAAGNFEVIVDLHKDTDLPDELLGERTLFIASGTVDAVVDFGGLGEGAVEVSDDRRAATITLPRPTLSDARIDPERSRVYDRQEGLFNEIGGLFGGSDENNERELYLLGERKLTEAAQEGAGLIARAETNTRTMLESMLGALGFTSVAVRFAPASG